MYSLRLVAMAYNYLAIIIVFQFCTPEEEEDEGITTAVSSNSHCWLYDCWAGAHLRNLVAKFVTK